MSIMIIYRETHENITLFHYSDCYHIYLKPMINIILKKKYWRSLSFTKKSIAKIMRNYTSCYLKLMEINTQNLS